MIDLRTDFGKRVQRRLEEERIGWLTTVSAGGAPCPRPIWFLWQDGTFLIYSRPNTYKLAHIDANPSVAINLDGDGLGGDIIVFQGVAERDPVAPPADQLQEYVRKYEPGFRRINMSAAQFASVYTEAIRVHPTSLRGH